MKWKPLLGIVFAVGGVVGAGIAIMSTMPSSSSSSSSRSSLSSVPAALSTSGQVKAISADQQTLTIAHQALHGTSGATVMTFAAATPTLFADVSVADRVQFSFVEVDGRRIIQAITKR